LNCRRASRAFVEIAAYLPSGLNWVHPPKVSALGRETSKCSVGMLWNTAEAAEKRKDAQVAREIVLALLANTELTNEECCRGCFGACPGMRAVHRLTTQSSPTIAGSRPAAGDVQAVRRHAFHLRKHPRLVRRTLFSFCSCTWADRCPPKNVGRNICMKTLRNSIILPNQPSWPLSNGSEKVGG
jgi:hypothetical protein